MIPFDNNIGLIHDHYELTMAQGYFLSGRYEKQSCFDYFFRKLPFGGGFVVFCGLSSVLGMLRDLSFGVDACNHLLSAGFHAQFVDYLRSFKPGITIHAVKEGEIIFPNEPVLRVEGNILEAQLVETLLLNILNFESLIATKASRMRMVAGEQAAA